MDATEQELSRVMAMYGQAAVDWAMKRELASPYSLLYWLRMAWSRGGLGEFHRD